MNNEGNDYRRDRGQISSPRVAQTFQPFDFLVLLAFACSSLPMPEHATRMPDQPSPESEFPLKKILSRTEKIFRVVVTVERIRGSKLIQVKR